MIPASEVVEAARIVRVAVDLLMPTSNVQQGRSGSDLRRVCGDLKSYAEIYIVKNMIGDKLAEAFEEARLTGATLDELNRVRKAILAENVVSVLAAMIKQACVLFDLQQMAIAVVDLLFTSRQDVERVRAELNPAFDQAEEVAADEMALDVYKATIALHAAVIFHLYQTALPLPQMLQYKFSEPRPTLVISYRLYDTATRADALRNQNKIVHPAFAPRQGQALAF